MLIGSIQGPPAFQLQRCKVIPPVNLQRMLFPFIENFFPDKDDWRIWVDNVMAGRREDTSRPKEQQESYPKVSYPAIRLLLLLARLRSVILQDYAAMMIIQDDYNEKHLDINHSFAIQHPVFSTSAFLSFASTLRASMKTPSDQSIQGQWTDTHSKVDESSVYHQNQHKDLSDTIQESSHQESHLTARHSLQANGRLMDKSYHRNNRNTDANHINGSNIKDIENPTDDINNGNNGITDSECLHENCDFAFLRPVLQLLYDKISSLTQENNELLDRNQKLLDRTRQLSERDQELSDRNQQLEEKLNMNRRPTSEIGTLMYDASIQTLRDEVQELQKKMEVLEDEKQEAVEFAIKTKKASDTLNERMKEMQEMIEGMWDVQAESVVEATNSNLAQLQDQQTLLKNQIEMMQRLAVINQRVISLEQIKRSVTE
ncbi:hypothetical protein FBU30_003809 [Linnemannia zychae]|nr:hypothetical protein FBU30_003809 [Linnemannia zychae]